MLGGEGGERSGGVAATNGVANLGLGNANRLLLGCCVQRGLLRVLLDLELLVGLLAVLPIVLPLVADHLAAGVQDVVAALADAVDVVADGGELAGLEGTRLGLQDLLEAIHLQLVVLQMVGLVFV